MRAVALRALEPVGHQQTGKDFFSRGGAETRRKALGRNLHGRLANERRDDFRRLDRQLT